jgi:hypothetical protein
MAMAVGQFEDLDGVPFTATGLSLGLLQTSDDGPVIQGFTLK